MTHKFTGRTQIHEICECENLEPTACWLGEIFIVTHINHDAFLKAEGTRVVHAKCGLPIHPGIFENWCKKDKEKAKIASTRHVIKQL